MRKILFVLLFSAFLLQAGLLDFREVKKGTEAYENKAYAKAEKHLQKLSPNNAAAAYDLGNAYYRQKQYEKALEQYAKVSDPALKFQVLHNMGNAQAQMEKIDAAIQSYKAALGIKEDADTRYNLELLKKQKERQEKQNKDDRDNAQQKKDQNGTSQNSSAQSQNGQKQDSQKQNAKNQNSSEGQHGSREGQNRSQPANEPNQGSNRSGGDRSQNQETGRESQSSSASSKSASGQPKNRQAPTSASSKSAGSSESEAMATPMQEAPISDQEERKWNRMLGNRGIRTLMLPLDQKGNSDAKNPW